MTLKTVTAYTVACNACGDTLEDENGGSLFTDPAGVPDVARAEGWTVLDGQCLVGGILHLCPTEDAGHQAFMDRRMPPEPTFPMPGQLPITEE